MKQNCNKQVKAGEGLATAVAMEMREDGVSSGTRT